jgi:hypothetical protein
MTRIEKVVKEVSELRDFYLKIQKRKQSGSSAYSQKPLHTESTSSVVEDGPSQKKSD